MNHFFPRETMALPPWCTGSPFLILQLSPEYFRILFASALFQVACQGDRSPLKPAGIQLEVGAGSCCISVPNRTPFACSFLWGQGERSCFPQVFLP